MNTYIIYTVNKTFLSSINVFRYINLHVTLSKFQRIFVWTKILTEAFIISYIIGSEKFYLVTFCFQLVIDMKANLTPTDALSIHTLDEKPFSTHSRIWLATLAA